VADERQVEDVVRWLRARLAALPDADDPTRPGAVGDIEAGLRRRLARLGGSPNAPRPLDRRFIREVIAPELELYWARRGRDPRP